MLYPATFTPGVKGKYDVTFVDLPGCVSQGDSLEDALRMAAEALSLHLRGMIADNDPLPKPSSLNEAQAKDREEAREYGYEYNENSIYQFITVDVRPHSTVRLSISLKSPVVERLDALADELGLTRSGMIAVATNEYIKRMER